MTRDGAENGGNGSDGEETEDGDLEERRTSPVGSPRTARVVETGFDG